MCVVAGPVDIDQPCRIPLRKGYQFFEFLGAPADSSGFQEEPEYVARCCAVKIARALGTIAMWDPAK